MSNIKTVLGISIFSLSLLGFANANAKKNTNYQNVEYVEYKGDKVQETHPNQNYKRQDTQQGQNYQQQNPQPRQTYQQQNNQQRQTYQQPHKQAKKNQTNDMKTQFGVYLELGADIGLSNVFHAETKYLDVLKEDITIKNPGGEFSGGVGVRIRAKKNTSVGLGLDIIGFDTDVEEKRDGGRVEDFDSNVVPIGYYLDFAPYDETQGTLDMTIFLGKITLENNFNDHGAFYLSIGAGGASYDIEGKDKDGKIVRYTDKYNNPALSIGAGFKVYFGKKKGLYLKAGLQYTKVLNDKLVINREDRITMKGTGEIYTITDKLNLKGGLGIGQAELKIGYQF